jgi:hypothetical protein
LPAESSVRKYWQIDQGVDIKPLMDDIIRQPELWNKNPCRLSKFGPHHETQDMILRYREEKPFRESKDWKEFIGEHIAVWNKSIDYLPAAKIMTMDLMSTLRGEVLGGVLIYKVEPGKQIYPHIDTGWHPTFYDKYNVCLASNSKAAFYYEDCKMTQEPGDIHWFRNNVLHWVKNEGDTDHIVMTICIRFDQGERAEWSPEGWEIDKSLKEGEYVCH